MNLAEHEAESESEREQRITRRVGALAWLIGPAIVVATLFVASA